MSILSQISTADGLDAHTEFCLFLTADAESDFNPWAVSPSGGSIGCFQQTLPWWTNDRVNVWSSARAFLADFKSKTAEHVGVPEIDCWFTQQWAAPDPRVDLAGFWSAPETVNYINRLPRITAILNEIHR